MMINFDRDTSPSVFDDRIPRLWLQVTSARQAREAEARRVRNWERTDAVNKRLPVAWHISREQCRYLLDRGNYSGARHRSRQLLVERNEVIKQMAAQAAQEAR